METIFASGAVPIRASLQVNPYQYLLKNNKKHSFDSEADYNRQIVDACRHNDVRIIAITDHYSIADSLTLIELAEDAGISALPGFEAATSDGVHHLVIFERGTPANGIERCIGACGVKDTTDESRIGTIDSRDLLGLAEGWGALVIAAHATDSKGLLIQLQGQAREEVWHDQRLTAVALSSELTAISEGHSNILRGKVAEYQRPHLPAIVYARDIISPEDLAKPTGWTSLKLSELSLDGIRHAFLDPQSRVRLAGDRSASHPYISSIRWTGGFLDGVGVNLSPSLNVFVGPRGAGKSTVLESIRFVLGLTALGTDAQEAHRGFVNHVLGSGTKVVVTITDPGRSISWSVERGVDGELVVFGSDGVQQDLSPLDLLGEVEFFGQHEVAELAKLPGARSRLLARFKPAVAKPQRDREMVGADLVDNRTALTAAREHVQQLAASAERLGRVEELLQSYAKAGVRERLDLEVRYEREKPLLSHVEELISESEAEANSITTVGLDFLSDDAIADLPSQDALVELRGALQQLCDAQRSAAADISRCTSHIRKLLDEAMATRDAAIRAGQDDYLARLRDLHAENIDGAAYLRLENEQATLKGVTSQIGDARLRVSELELARSDLLKEWLELRRRELGILEQAARKVTTALKGTVRARCTFEGDRQPLVDFVRDNTTGQMHIASEAVGREDAGFGPGDLAGACRGGDEKVSTLLGIEAGQQVKKLAALDEPILMQMEELWLEPTTSIELRVGEDSSGAPVWRPLERLSTGEKATAILLVLLLTADASAPLVVDQAEDDLDNAFIADDIVPRLRREKHRRQFILSTHNPNIPVLGDAEQVLKISAEGEATDGGRAAVLPEHTGSLDRASVRTILETLEGGKEAFERRRRRYGY
jgi:hypothetical protein